MTGSTTHHLSVLTEEDIRRIVREEIEAIEADKRHAEVALEAALRRPADA